MLAGCPKKGPVAYMGRSDLRAPDEPDLAGATRPGLFFPRGCDVNRTTGAESDPLCVHAPSFSTLQATAG